jgi:hypothetical protein
MGGVPQGRWIVTYTIQPNAEVLDPLPLKSAKNLARATHSVRLIDQI